MRHPADTATSRRSRRQWMNFALGEQRRQQAEIEIVVRHLVHDPRGRVVQVAQLIEVSLRHAVESVSARQRGDRCEDALVRRLRTPRARKSSRARKQFAGPEDLRMSGENLFGQVVPERGKPTMNTGRSVSRPKPRTRSKNAGVKAAMRFSTKRALFVEIVALVRFGDAGPASGRWPVAAGGGLLRSSPLASQTWARPKSSLERSASFSSGSASRCSMSSRSDCGSLPRSKIAN